MCSFSGGPNRVGASHSQPKGGPDRPALYVVDNRKPKTDLRTVRLVVSDYDMGAVSNGGVLSKIQISASFQSLLQRHIHLQRKGYSIQL
ncbi:MAG: hypothetical protein CM1200mP29_01290 [Verrucomicrobiota bacterium]|nr:MAG: hypothetical protein CM1200mP29_01290 [Verrucomicrobiota bacterium]